MSWVSWFAKPTPQPNRSGEALAFVRSFIREAELPAAILSVQGRGGSETVAFRPGDPALAPFLAKHAARRVHIMTAPMAELSATRIVSVIGAPPEVMAFDPRPAIAVETPKGICAAWRLVNPTAAMKAHGLAAKIAARIGGKPGGQFFPVPGCGGLSILQHLKGREAWTLVTSIDGALNVGAGEVSASEPLFRPSTDYESEATDWLWPNVIACGDLTLLGGAPGMGKSQVAIYAAATVSRGGQWPDGSRAKRGSTILCETEDRPGNALRPRLEAAGADLARVHFGRHVDLSANMAALAGQAEALPDLRLLVLSPVLTFFGPTSNDDNTVRAKLRPLLEWAASRNVAVLGIIHPLKDGPVDAFAGCDAYRRACRAAWRLVIDPADPEPVEKLKRRVMIAAKVNNAPDALRILYRIKGVALPAGIETSRIEFLPTGQGVEQSAKGTKGASVWLKGFLAQGAKEGGEVKRAALDAGIAKATLYRAARELGIVPGEQEDSLAKLWTLPEE